MADDYTPTTEEVRTAYATEVDDIGHVYRDPGSEADFDRWLAEHTAQKRAEWEAERGEAEWEYGLMCDEGHVDSWGVPFDEGRELPAMRGIADATGERIVRRAAPGEWVPVNENGETTA